MIAAAALALAAMFQDTSLVVGPVYRNAAFGVELPRPFDDWQFAPATERGTTSVIFHPRAGSLSDQLWGALIMTPWGGPVPIAELADSRIADSWRRAFGSSFTLRTRDSVEVAGLPAIHIVVGGSLDRVMVDVEEYLIARDSDFILLEFRYPRGYPRDSIAAGYRRALDGLRIRGGLVRPATEGAVAASWAPTVEGGQLVFQLPEGLRAVTTGSLTSEVVAGGMRSMRWRPLDLEEDPLYAVGRFRAEQRAAGRLTLCIWREDDPEVGAIPATDSLLATLARGWSRYWTAFGPIPLTELVVVETDWPRTRGAAGIVFIGADASDESLLRELARTWWGGFIRATGPSAPLVREALPAWSPLLLGVAILTPGAGESAALIEQARREAGEARFREAIRTLAAEGRGSADAYQAFLSVLGPGAGRIRQLTGR